MSGGIISYCDIKAREEPPPCRSFVPPTATIEGFNFSDAESRRQAGEKGLIR
jgi:hypothetical protein